MKKLILLVLFLFLIQGCAGWQINGIESTRFTEAELKDIVVITAGAVCSVGVHWLGHVAYVETNSIEWHQSWDNEIIEDNISKGKLSAFGRAGFVAQLITGVFLNSTIPDSYFTTGYDALTLFEIGTYPVFSNGDLKCMNYAGNAPTEWAVYTGIAAYLLYYEGVDK